MRKIQGRIYFPIDYKSLSEKANKNIFIPFITKSEVISDGLISSIRGISLKLIY